jgi:nucleoside-triphosphatase
VKSLNPDNMKSACLLTGLPGTGKTTLIQEAISQLKITAGGFYTREIRNQGARQGFEIVTLDDETAVLAHINISGHYRVSKYGVALDNLEKVAVPAMQKAIQESQLVVIDEIGKMELFSPAFRDTVWQALASGKRILGTIMLQAHPYADEIKCDPRVKVLQLTRANRQQILQEIIRWLEPTMAEK